MTFVHWLYILKTFLFNLALSCIGNEPSQAFMVARCQDFKSPIKTFFFLNRYIFCPVVYLIFPTWQPCTHTLSVLRKKCWWAENTGKHLRWSLAISEIFCSNSLCSLSRSHLRGLLQLNLPMQIGHRPCELKFSWFVLMWKCNKNCQ